MLGNLTHPSELKEDDMLGTVAAVAETALIPSFPAPTHQFYTNGVFGNEIRLVEDLFCLTRSALIKKLNLKNNFSVNRQNLYIQFQIFIFAVTIWLDLKILIDRQRSI